MPKSSKQNSSKSSKQNSSKSSKQNPSKSSKQNSSKSSKQNSSKSSKQNLSKSSKQNLSKCYFNVPTILISPAMDVKEHSDTGTPLVTVTPPVPETVPAKFQMAIGLGCSDEDLEDHNDEEEEYHVIPPDGGWGWVVVAASFMCNAVVDGIIFTSGQLFPTLREAFGASNSEVAWISSLLGGFYLLVGPFVSALANAFGFRLVCILGAVVASGACGLSYFATSIYFLYGSFGILGGMGFGLIYVPAVISTGFYFERRRALATGIAVCGSGIGTFIMSPVNTYLLSTLGDQWRIIFLVYAGIILTCAFFGLAFRPLTASTGKKVKIGEEIEISGTPLLIRIKRAREQELANCPSILSMGSFSMSPSKLTLEEGQGFAIGDGRTPINNAMVARNLLERHGGGNINKRISVTGTLPILEETEHQSEEDNNGNQTEASTIQQPLMVQPQSVPQVCSTNSLGLKEFTGFNGGNCHLDDNKNETKKSFGVKYPRIESAPHLNIRSNLIPADGDARSRRASKISLRSEQNRPFYRNDIFYSGSLARLSQYQSSDTLAQYHASVTNLPPEIYNEATSEGSSSGKCCPTSISNVLSRIFDFSLLSSVTFIVLSLSGFMALMSLFVPFNFLPSFAMDNGIDPGDASFVMSLIGIFNTVGRIIAGWVSDHPKVDALLVNNLALMIGGAATIVLPFLTNLSLLYAYAVLFGLSVAAFASLRSILLVELLGLEKLTNAFGLLLLFQGLAATFGSPIAGAFVDLTEEYKISFYVFGSIFALSGIICFPLRKIKAWEDARLDEKLRKQKYGIV